MSEIKLKTIKAVPLNAEDYKPFGNVLEAKPKSESANQGTALRSDWLGNFFCVNKLIDRFIFYWGGIENKRDDAKMNVCVFRSTPRTLPFEINKLERHEFSTQMFIPMNGKRYLVIVAQGGELPGKMNLSFQVILIICRC